MSLEPLTVQLLVLELRRTLLACPLVLPAVGLWQSTPQYFTRRQALQFLSLTLSLPCLPQLAQASSLSTGTQLILGQGRDKKTPLTHALSRQRPFWSVNFFFFCSF